MFRYTPWSCWILSAFYAALVAADLYRGTVSWATWVLALLGWVFFRLALIGFRREAAALAVARKIVDEATKEKDDAPPS